MSSNDELTAANVQHVGGSRSRYKGNRPGKKVPGQMTPLAKESTSKPMARLETEETNYHLRVAKAWSEWQDSLDRTLQDQNSTADDPISHVIQQYTTSLPDQPMICQEEMPKKESRTDRWTDLPPDTAGLIPATSLTRQEATSTGYVATLRRRGLGITLPRKRVVSLPQIVITPPTPTIGSFQEQASLNSLLLTPPPPCYKRKDRTRLAEKNAAKAIMLKKRNSSAHGGAVQLSDRQAGTARTDNLEMLQKKGRSIRHDAAPGNAKQIDNVRKDDEAILRSTISSVQASSSEGDRCFISQNEVAWGSMRETDPIRTADFMDCRVEAVRSTAVQYEKNLMSKLQRLGF